MPRGHEHRVVVLSHHADRRHHVLLRQTDLDVTTADARAPFEERVVVWADQARVHPRHERSLESIDLGLAPADRRVRSRVGEDAGVEVLGDLDEAGSEHRVQRAKSSRILGAEADVALDVIQERIHRGTMDDRTPPHDADIARRWGADGGFAAL
jgi:hypothetical protein